MAIPRKMQAKTSLLARTTECARGHRRGYATLRSVIRTGKRTEVLADALTASGLKRLSKDSVPMPPRASNLPNEIADEALSLYRNLGGTQAQPNLRPGPWDLVFDGLLVVEFDEELHFNRYRAQTLTASWERSLPWTVDYRRHCVDCEAECLAAGAWGRRWTNDSAGRMFSGGKPGELDGEGAPRWKQRALYDALKDTVAVWGRGVRLARVATYDRVGGLLLGAMLDGVSPLDVSAIRELVETRAA
jgi:hypothetical protein